MGLNYLHSRDIAHSHLKSDAIFVDTEGRVKISASILQSCQIPADRAALSRIRSTRNPPSPRV